MAGILDLFDSPDLLSNLFGISPAAAKTPPAPTPLPPFQGSAEPPLQGGGFGGPPVQTTSLGPSGPGPQAPPPQQPPLPPNAPIPDNASFAQRAAPMQGDLANGAFDGMDPRYNDFQPNSMRTSSERGGDFSPDPNMAQPPNPGFAPPMSSPPMPMPRPGPQGPGGPTQMADASGRVPIPAQPAPPPPPSVMAQPGGPPMTGTAGGLSASLGLNPNAMQIGLAGLGKGLSAVGAQPAGTTAGRSFAAGAGGALTGSNEQMERNQAQARQAQNDAFNQKSTAFKDWMANNLDASRAKYFDAFAAQKKAGASGSNAWQNTPYGKAQNLEKMLDSWEQQQRLQLAAKWKAVGSTPDEVKADLSELQTRKEAERTRRSKALGIDPEEHLNGTSSDKPFDFNKLTPQQRLDVPDGAYYKYKDPNDPKADKDGNVIKQRDWLSTPPYEGWEPPGGQAPPQQAQLPNPQQADYQAMQ